MALTDQLTTWATWTRDWLRDPTWMAANSIQQTFYGDVENVGPTPLICVVPGNKSRVLEGSPRKTVVDFEVTVIVYLGRLGDTEATLAGSDTTAEIVETRLHSNPTCGGLVIHSMVTDLTSGVSNKGGSLIRAARLTWTARSQVLLPYP